MRRLARASTLVALACLVSAPLALASDPKPAAWSPYDAISPVNALALSADGSTSAAALAAPPAPSAGNTNVAKGDLSIIDSKTGFVANGSTGNAPTTVPLGRGSVAISADGRAIASLGLAQNAAPSAGQPTPPTVLCNPGDPTSCLGCAPTCVGTGTPSQPAPQFTTTLYYEHLLATRKWGDAKTNDPSSTSVAVTLQGVGVRVLESADGSRVVALTNNGTQFLLYAYTFDGASLRQQFLQNEGGFAFDVGVSSDFEHLVVASQIQEAGNQSHAAAWEFGFTTGQLLTTQYDRSVNGSAFLSAGATPDGRLLVGDTHGHLFVASPQTDLIAIPLPGVATNVSRIAFSGDGSRAAVATGDGVALLDVSRFPSVLWDAPVSGLVNALSLNHTGGTIVAAVNGSSGGVYAFGDADANVLWHIPGNAASAAIDDAGLTVAYAQNSVVSLATLPRHIAFQFAGGAKTTDPVVVKPGGSATVQAEVRNPGAALERIAFDLPRDVDVTIKTFPEALAVEPGATANVTLTATVGPTFTGRHAFNVTARAITSNATDDITLSLNLQATTNVTLTLNGPSDVTVAPGVPTTLLLGIVNNGTKDVALGMKAVQQPTNGPEWNVTLDPSSFTLGANRITTVRGTVTAPQGTPNGTSDTVTFIMQGPDVGDQVTVTFRINPTLGVHIESAARVKFVEPGKEAFFNVTITNTGSVPRSFQAFPQTTSSNGRNWAVEMDGNPFALDPQASRTIEVRAFAPQDAAPDDHVSIFIQARSIQQNASENVTQDNLTLSAIVIRPTPTTTTPTSAIPAPGAIAVVGSIAIIALALRRRRAP